MLPSVSRVSSSMLPLTILLGDVNGSLAAYIKPPVNNHAGRVISRRLGNQVLDFRCSSRFILSEVEICRAFALRLTIVRESIGV